MKREQIEILKSVGSKNHKCASERKAGTIDNNPKAYVRHPKHKGKVEKSESSHFANWHNYL